MMANIQVKVPSFDLAKLLQVFSNLAAHHIHYGLGAKIKLDTDSHSNAIHAVDCSGWVRYGAYKATNGLLVMPDGSWNQRAWCEKSNLHKLAHYSDILQADENRLFVHFITPHVNGCGSVGHTWYTYRPSNGATPMTLESHGGKGIDSRRYDYPVLRHQVSHSFELPTLG